MPEVHFEPIANIDSEFAQMGEFLRKYLLAVCGIQPDELDNEADSRSNDENCV